MSEENKKKYAPILPFDATLAEHFIMYDNAAYHQNTALCGKESIHLDSGNVIKFYSCKENTPFLVGGK